MQHHTIGFSSPEGAIDYLEIDGCGVLRVHGWYHDYVEGKSTIPELSLNDGVRLGAAHRFRTNREDVNQALGLSGRFMGMVFEYFCPEDLLGVEGLAFEVCWSGERIASGASSVSLSAPSYPYLLNDRRIFHRDWIYCSGLPVDYLNPEVLSLAQTLGGPVLDLGCGTGALTEALRNGGLDVTGLELDRADIKQALPSNRKAYVDLYEGSLPLPYGDASFGSVIVSEVLEHLPEPEDMMHEVARICKSTLLVTVPDLSGVPLNHKNGVVPWHLLESTHVNFFNPTSLKVFLKNWFPDVELYRIGNTVTNNTPWWGGLMALARK